MKKSFTTQELANIFPEWSKVRTNHQSVGYQLLNSLAQPLEKMDTQLEKMRKNEFLTTINQDEIDLTYRVVLPTTFVFDTDTTDPTNTVSLPPTVQGLVITTNPTFSGYVDVALAEHNDIQSFWYESVPNRATLDLIASGEYVLLDQTVFNFPWSGTLEHHLKDEEPGGGRLWVETTGGAQYISTNENNELERGRITLRGITRKGTEEEEQMAFPWDEKRPSLKEWKTLSSVDIWDMETGVNVTIRSADFNASPYWSFWNLRVSPTRTKVDEFWAIDSVDSNLINRVGLITDEWQQAMLGFSQKEYKERWEMLDEHWIPVAGVDLAVQPFTNRAWVVDDEKKIHCYSLDETMVSGVSLLQPRSAGPEAQLEVENYNITLGEDIVFTPWHARTLKEIISFRVWYQDPTGTKFGILDGAPVSYTSDFWTTGVSIKRVISAPITITSAYRGEYLLVLETNYIDGSSDSDRAIVSVQYKLPLTTIDLSDIVPDTILGIDFDADQKLWVRTQNFYYQIGLHTDIMLIDYTNKVLYFREDYADVRVTT
jgi:hypothetical protein